MTSPQMRNCRSSIDEDGKEAIQRVEGSNENIYTCARGLLERADEKWAGAKTECACVQQCLRGDLSHIEPQ